MSVQLPGRVQGRDSIEIDASIEALWELIANTRLLPRWGPPVVDVEVLDEPEGPGSRRRIDAKFGSREGSYVERRLIHEPLRRMAFQIEEETFGLFRFLENVGSMLELEPVTPFRTRVTFTFFHDAHGLAGRLMNRLIILRDQRANRLRALESLKRYAEEGRERAEP